MPHSLTAPAPHPLESLTRRARPFAQVDVFGAAFGLGNPLAVVLDSAGLDDEAMQRFATWTQLSETTFLVPPTMDGADYRVRIFTPAGELSFGGHPTLGACHAWLQAGGKPANPDLIIQQCGIGKVQIRRMGGRLHFRAPPIRRINPDATLVNDICAGLGIPFEQVQQAQWLENGPNWLALQLGTVQEVLDLRPNFTALELLGVDVGVVGIDQDAQGHTTRVEVRGFPLALGVQEDSVTGSLHAGLAQWLAGAAGLPEEYVSRQGRCLRRDGRVYILHDDPKVWVGGDCRDGMTGTVLL